METIRFWVVIFKVFNKWIVFDSTRLTCLDNWAKKLCSGYTILEVRVRVDVFYMNKYSGHTRVDTSIHKRATQSASKQRNAPKKNIMIRKVYYY
ncbi:hypothetical protein Hanom_Chr11g01055201 [Helianthus anomalus]